LNQLRKRLTYANVMSSIAVFLMLGGATALAASKKINGNRIKAGTIKTGKFAKEAVKTGKIAQQAVTESRIADGAVTTNKLADNAVTESKIADNAVTTNKIANEAVKAEKLAGESVTNTKIAANAVTQGKIAGASVGSPQLKGISVVSATSAKVANGTSIGVTATCPSGQVIAGGFETEGVGADKWAVKRLLRSGNGWRVFGVNESGGESSITAFAYCLAA